MATRRVHFRSFRCKPASTVACRRRRATQRTTLGLNFERHIPEYMALLSARVSPGAMVGLRNGAHAVPWRVSSIEGDEAVCVPLSGGGEGNLTVDIMEPHLDTGDSVAKAHGLARFALDNPGAFGRVEMLRKSIATGPLYRLPLGDPATAGAILDLVLTAGDLNNAFANRGYVADW